MTATGAPTVIRLPVGVRIFTGAFTFVWCGGVLAFAVASAIHRPGLVVFPLAMLVFGGTIAYRQWRVSVSLGTDELLVRNYFKTRRIAREKVEGFRIGEVSHQLGRSTVYVLIRGDAVLPLDVAAGSTYLYGQRRRRALEERLSTLQSWLDRASPGHLASPHEFDGGCSR